ncbi:conserved protein [Pectobacterium atrosepticum SCRI1043]|uniref:Conserved protein n=1 Tax=Pectobacterium atrosepticum (strain SCRI 1043 / ATCC BAA-672) TaxID=218491 RepID=Q6D620_PECAS|nr:conserved protein [Pectobacterium atrosepticum SCRI1043]
MMRIDRKACRLHALSLSIVGRYKNQPLAITRCNTVFIRRVFLGSCATKLGKNPKSLSFLRKRDKIFNFIPFATLFLFA